MKRENANNMMNSSGGALLYGIQRYDYVKYYAQLYRSPLKQDVEYDLVGFPLIASIQEAFKKILMKQNRYMWLDNIYHGIQQVWDRKWESVTGIQTVKVMCNEAKQLTQNAASFLLAKPISYSMLTNDTESPEQIQQDAALKLLMDKFTKQQISEHDLSEATIASRFGVAYEYSYYDTKADAQGLPVLDAKGNPQSELCTVDMSPLNASVIYHNAIKNKKAYGVYFVEKLNKNWCGREIKYEIVVYNDQESRLYRATMDGTVYFERYGEAVMVGDVPITELENNNDRTCDWEHVVSLMDMSNDLMCDRANDVATHVDAILAIMGASSEYSTEQMGELSAGLKKFKILSLREGEAGEFLSNPLDQTGIQVALDFNQKMIHKLTGIVDYTDSSMATLAQNAMKLRLQPFISLADGKAANYKKFLLDRLNIYARDIEMTDGGVKLDISSIKMNFTYGVPTNDLEISAMITNLRGIVSDETLAEQLSFVESGKDEVEKAQREEAEKNNMDFRDIDNDIEDIKEEDMDDGQVV